jgi:hypothetical protein
MKIRPFKHSQRRRILPRLAPNAKQTKVMTNPPTPALKKHGRPTKFSRALVQRVLSCLERGLPLSTTAHVCGITFQTFSNYRAKHPKFADAISSALARGIQSRLNVVVQATESADEAIKLRAATWLLEHCNPELFARNRIEVTGADGAPLAAAVAIYLPQKENNSQPAIEINPPKQLNQNAT